MMQQFLSMVLVAGGLLMTHSVAQMQGNEPVFRHRLSATGYMDVLGVECG
jgi:hypothetical protein